MPVEEDFEDDQHVGEGDQEVGDDEDKFGRFHCGGKMKFMGMDKLRKKFKKKSPRQATCVS